MFRRIDQEQEAFEGFSFVNDNQDKMDISIVDEDGFVNISVNNEPEYGVRFKDVPLLIKALQAIVDYETPSIPQAPSHTCPYKEDIHGDYSTLCHCDPERTAQCADSI